MRGKLAKQIRKVILTHSKGHPMVKYDMGYPPRFAPLPGVMGGMAKVAPGKPRRMKMPCSRLQMKTLKKRVLAAKRG